MRIYAISGLGADERVFKFLNLDHELIPLNWLTPLLNESIEAYANRFIKKYSLDKEDNFGILGVSFGGLLAIEISKILSPKVTIQVSSTETKNGLRSIFKIIGRTGIIKLIPKRLFNPPRKLAYYVFGTNQKVLLNSILDDTDLTFAKWAVNELCNWKNEKSITNLIQICGTKDKLIPPTKARNILLIKGGEHFMIVDKAQEISQLINNKLKKVLIL